MSLPPPALARTATTVPGALEKDTGLRYHSSRRAANFQWRVKRAEVKLKKKKREPENAVRKRTFCRACGFLVIGLLLKTEHMVKP